MYSLYTSLCNLSVLEPHIPNIQAKQVAVGFDHGHRGSFSTEGNPYPPTDHF